MTVRQIPQQPGRQSPFEAKAPGFTDSWWDRHTMSQERFEYEHFTFRLGGDEVVRVETKPRSRLSSSYVGLDTQRLFVEVLFFEVRDGFRKRGYGPEAVQWLTGHYATERLFAFSENADGFWQSVGWECHARTDGEGWPHYRPLFVSPEG